MQLPDLKELKKLIAVCRSQGIKVFELGEMKITLTDEAPPKRTRGESLPKYSKGSIQGNEVPDSLPSEEELLFAAVGGPPDFDSLAS